MHLVLASASQGRKHLLKQLKIPFEILPSNIDEDSIIGKNPLETIQFRAKLKSEKAIKQLNNLTIHQNNTESLIISADTEVVFHNILIGKPKDLPDAIRIFKILSGNTHEVISALCIVKIRNGKVEKIWSDFDRSWVTFRNITEAEIKRYLSLTEYTRFTGGYALAKSPQNFIIKIEGSVSNVIGMPLEKVISVLEENKLL